MVCLYAVTLQDIRINGSLCQKLNAVQLLCLVGKHLDKLLADDLSLGLRVGNAGQLVQETVDGIHIDQVCIHLVAEYFYDLLGLTLSKQTVVHMDTYQLFADGLDQKCCYYRRVHSAGQCQQYLLVTDLAAKSCDLLCNKAFGKCRGGDTFHGFGTLIVFHHDSSLEFDYSLNILLII